MHLKLLLTLASSLLFAPQLLAAPGDIDMTFGANGRGLASVGKISLDQGRAAALQPDGKIIVVGDTILAGEWLTEPANLIVVRLNPDGSRDSSFGIGGIVVERLSMSVTGASVVVQNDGKIVVGGFANVEVSVTVIKRAFVLVRLLPNGASDPSFGTGGVVTSVLDPGQHTTLTSLALQSDGKIVATGFAGVSSPTATQSIVAARYNTDGTPDNAFDGDGKLFIVIGSSNRANAVAIQSDGKIILGGAATAANPTDFLLVRLNTDGSYDNTFDGDGRVSTSIAAATSAITALALLGDGRIVAAGTSGSGSSRNIAVARYNTDGGLDNTFDTDGIVLTDIGDDIAADARIQSDGKIVVGGHTTDGLSPFVFLAIRYNTDGSLDNTFDTDGKVTTRVGALGTNRTSALLLQADGRITLAGSLIDAISGDLALVRYNADGVLDSGFDGDGKALLELGNAGDSVYAMAVQPDGKIVSVGYVFGGWVPKPGVARFNADGTPDTTFGDQGSVIYPGPSPDYGFIANDVAIQSDGKIIFTIHSEGIYPYTVVRLNPNGTYDESFGTGGTVTFPVSTTRDKPAGLELQPDGKIVVAGTSEFDLSSGPSIIRLNSNGTPDVTFGTGGKVLTTDPALSGAVYAVTLQPDGKIILAGGGFVSNSYTFFTTRYNAVGTIDSSFGGTGVVNTPIGSSFNSASMIAVQSDGKIVVGGMSVPGSAAVRYSANGTLDNSFDGDGKIIIPGTSTLYPSLGDVAIQSNGKIVFVGSERMPIGTFGIEKFNAAVFRFNSDGSPDPLFGVDGKVVNTIGDHNSSYSAVSLLSNGRIIAGGTSSNGLNDDFTLVRYIGDFSGSRAPFDFDGDDKTDIGIFRPAGGEWWINRSSTGVTFALQFGASTDRIAPADFTGDGKTDIAFFRPSSGEWYVLRSEDFSFFALPFGTNGDVPVPADYDADGKADFAVFRPSSSTWFISQSSGAPTRIEQFGITGDMPVVSDYDRDGKADVGIFRAAVSGAEWWINRSTAGLLAMQFGANTDKAVQGDYTGDGKADVAIWRPSTGEWLIVRSEDFSFYGFPFGANGDVPSPGDYDGDGKFDATVFRPSSATWFIGRTTAGTQIVQFGATGDRPLPNAFVP